MEDGGWWKVEGGWCLAGIVVDAIVQLHRLVPVVLSWCIVETVVACSLGRGLGIWLFLTMIEVKIGRKTLTRAIVEIILQVKAVIRIVVLA